MDLTESYKAHFPVDVLNRYEFIETRNAAAILNTTNPAAHAQIIKVLRDFSLRESDLLLPGGQESNLANRLNHAFRTLGWREARVDTLVRLNLRKMPYAPAGETQAVVVDTETESAGYLVDNFRDRVALDVEWNAKDGNLDRDISAYRSLYDAGLIDVSAILTRTQTDLRLLARSLASMAGWTVEDGKKILGTTTTTNVEKLKPRITRGDAGGCPFLGILISADTYIAEPLSDQN